ncbi:SKP1 [Tripterygium wilfordii]|uniref:SKP1 n=1 Tax=Tripterygium wilfordii TaxID=458696 RepID=A0A7J7DXA2_TRIWF|nr:SKP1-like protein 15 [Tripterygium wilfordii]KAF5750726.1 SKP1 [Tripterygium wilfordii]
MLSLVISYWTGRLQLPDESEEKLKAYNAEFLKEQIIDDLAKISFAANYLEINDLLDVSNQAIADRIKNRSVEYVRNLKFWGFDPKTDFWTKEEEEELRTSNAFAFEGVDPDDDDSQSSS